MMRIAVTADAFNKKYVVFVPFFDLKRQVPSSKEKKLNLKMIKKFAIHFIYI